MNIESIRSDWLRRVIDGRFTLLEWLGSSEYSAVFLTEMHAGRPFKAAIKFLPANAPDADARFAGWTAAADLSHPHFLRLFAAGRCRMDGEDWIYVVSEYSDEFLAEIVKDRPLSPHEGRELLGPIVDALSWLHEKGLVHGRLKPSNLLVVDDRLKISGDSIYRTGVSCPRMPVSSAPVSSVYDAPECAEGVISPAADVWSLGVTLIEALTQHPPAWDRSIRDEPQTRVPLLPPFAEIARECLQIDPAHRCTLAEIAALLKTGAHLPRRSRKEQVRSARPRALMVGAGVFVVAALVTILVMGRAHNAEPSSPSESHAQTPAASPATSVAPAPAPVAHAASAPVPVRVASTRQSGREKGEVLERVLPEVPPFASRTIQGKVALSVQVTVDSNGAVSDATLEPPDKSKYFSNLALKAARGWKFKPAQVGGQPVASTWKLRFQFRQSGIDVTPVEETP